MSDTYRINSSRRSGDSKSIVNNGSATISVDSESFRAPELLLGALGNCMLATLIDYAERNKIPLREVAVDVVGEVENRPRRITRIHASFHLPSSLTGRQTDALLRAGARCTVHNTLESSAEISASCSES